MPKRNKNGRGGGVYAKSQRRPYHAANGDGRGTYGGQQVSQASTETECDRVCATIPRMSNLASLSEQMAYAYGALSLTEQDHMTRRSFMGELEADLTVALRGRVKCCYLYAFGSSINELGMKNCDLDLVLVTNGEISEHWGNQIPDTRNLLNLVKNRLYQKQGELGMADIFPIKSARVPLIKFRHMNTNINCDVSFNRRMGVLNSRLIAHVMQFSRSAKLLAFTVRLWGKQKNFVGGGGTKINSYSMTLMVIFFLQQVNVLPALKLLQRPNNTLRDDREGECFYATLDDFEPFRDQVVHYSESELLTGFLGYFIRFSFETTIISVYHGQPIHVADHPTFNAQAINVQDPFDRDYNTTKGVKPGMKAWFRKCLSLTWAHRNVLCQPCHQDEPWGLQYLFQPVEFDTKPKKASKAAQCKAKHKGIMADYVPGAGRTLQLDIVYSQSGPTEQYVRYCVQVVRTLRELYDMTVETPSSNHPLSEALRQVMGRKRLSTDPLEGHSGCEVKRVKSELPCSSSDKYIPQIHHYPVQSTSASSQLSLDLEQPKPSISLAGGKVPIEYYVPYTIQVGTYLSDLRSTTNLHIDSFSYPAYVREIEGYLQKRATARAVNFTISFQPHDARFGTVDLEVTDINTGYIESICSHLGTVLPLAILQEPTHSL